MPKSYAHKLLDAVIVTGAGTAVGPSSRFMAFQARGATSASTGAAVIDIEVSTDGVVYEVLGTISLTLGTTATADSFVAEGPWPYVRANVTSISGTDATVTCNVSNESGL